MTPRYTVDDVLDGRRCNPAFFGQFAHGDSASRMLAANFSHEIVSHLGVGARFAATTVSATLGVHVGNVVGVRSEPEVRQVDAFWLVPAGAIVQDVQSIGDRTMMDCPGHPMSEEWASALGSSARSDLAIPVSVKGPNPEPAVIGLFDQSPESCFERNPLVGRYRPACSGAESSEPLLEISGSRYEGGSTLLTRTWFDRIASRHCSPLLGLLCSGQSNGCEPLDCPLHSTEISVNSDHRIDLILWVLALSAWATYGIVYLLWR